MSVTLSHDNQNNSPGVNLKWVTAGLGAVREITLIYFKNTNDAEIQSVDINPSATKHGLKSGFDSGASYQFQLQVSDVGGLVVYSNLINVTTPFFLVSPSITSITGLDAKLKVTLGASGNILTNADEVEFVIKRQSDNALFWIVMPYVASGIYTLQHGSLVNQDSYRVACMYQPVASNANYSAPSSMSNSMTGVPTNIPNTIPGNVTGVSAGTTDYSCKFNWLRPTDFNEWGSSFYVQLKLTDSTNVETNVTLAHNYDVTEHTFTGLEAGKTYKCAVHYENDFGSGTPVNLLLCLFRNYQKRLLC